MVSSKKCRAHSEKMSAGLLGFNQTGNHDQVQGQEDEGTEEHQAKEGIAL